MDRARVIIFETQIKKCENTLVEDSRVVWLCIYGISTHTWSSDFFVGLADSLGSFVCIDKPMSKGDFLDLARILVKVSTSFVVPVAYQAIIDDKVFPLILREDNFAAYRLGPSYAKSVKSAASSESED